MSYQLDWDAIFHHGVTPPPELEVVPSDELAPSEVFSVNEPSDHELVMETHKLHKLLDGSFILKRLQGNGAKI